MYAKFVKRILDIMFALFFLILFFPLFILIAVLVKIKLGSPVIYIQDRPGYKEKIFKCYKFRTMTEKKDINGKLLPDEERLTSFGKILRATSLDEIPEFYNILIGDMSFVGPRPLLVEYLQLYNKEQKRRHDVMPGLTGLAQVKGRNAIDWGKKFEYDLYYVDNLSFLLDIKIIILTIFKVFKRDGIYMKESEASLEEYVKNNN